MFPFPVLLNISTESDSNLVSCDLLDSSFSMLQMAISDIFKGVSPPIPKSFSHQLEIEQVIVFFHYCTSGDLNLV